MFDESDDDEFYDEPEQFEVPRLTSVQYSIPGSENMSAYETKLFNSRYITNYGETAATGVNVRFIIGPDQKKVRPGKASGEIDKFKREWRDLTAFGKQHNWRQILDNNYPTRNYNESMSFIIDNIEWKTITHFLLGMLYRKDVQYALSFSLADRNNQNGYWGDVKSAMENHYKNLNSGYHEPDPEFGQHFPQYLVKSLLAKFTQNPVAKKSLLLTEDAILSMRTQDGLVDLPALMQVRGFIVQSPNSIYRGDSVPVENATPEVPILTSSEQLNRGEIPTPKNVRLVFESLGIRYPELEEEEISETECIVYIMAGVFNIDLDMIIKNYANGSLDSLKYVKRHIYGVERFADNVERGLLIGVQRNAVSVMSEYITINITIDMNSPVDISLYLQPFEEGYSIFAVAAIKDDRVKDLVLSLT